MGPTMEDFYSRVKDLMTQDEFDEQIRIRKQRYDDLFDEDTLALLFIDELGRNTTCLSSIADLIPGTDCSCIGTITQIQNTRNFQRKNGSTGTVANLVFTDDTGSISLVLWNEQVDLIKSKTIQEQTKVKIINGYVKDGYQGAELCVGRWSSIDILDQPSDIAKDTLSIPSSMISGTIEDISPTTAFFKDDGSFGFVTKLSLRTDDGTKMITVWDEQVKHLQTFKKGDQLQIKNIDIRKQQGTKELHVNGKATITKC
jgi:replication factor A1